jgi:hypothetical protein
VAPGIAAIGNPTPVFSPLRSENFAIRANETTKRLLRYYMVYGSRHTCFHGIFMENGGHLVLLPTNEQACPESPISP